MTAMVTAAVIGAGATVYSAYNSAKAQDRAGDIAEDSASRQAAIAERQLAMAEDQYDRYKTLYGPAEEQFISEARGFGSQANQEQAAIRAEADAVAAAGGAKQRFEQNLASLGVNPNDQKFANTMAGMELQGAAARAGAKTAARDKIRDTGLALEKDVVSLGKGLPSSASSMMSNAASGFGAGANGQIAALNNQANSWGQAATGLGGLTGSIIKSDAFQNWWNTPSGSGLTGANSWQPTANLTTPNGTWNGNYW